MGEGPDGSGGDLSDRTILAVACLAGVLAAGVSWIVPLWQAPDEPAFFHYADTIAREGRLPVLGTQRLSGAYYDYVLHEPRPRYARFEADGAEGLRYQAHHPPLPFACYAVPDRIALALDWEVASRARLLRGTSVCMGFLLVLGIGTLLRRVVPGEGTVQATALLVAALLPSRIHLFGVISNDLLTELLLVLLAHLLLSLPDGSFRGGILVGAVAGGAVLSKLTALFVGLPLAIRILRSGPDRERARSRMFAAVGAGFLLVTGWWFVRNHALYGDWVGRGAFEEVMIKDFEAGWPLERALGFLKRVGMSFYAGFGWSNLFLPPAAYRLLVLASVVPLLLAGCRRWLRGGGGESTAGGIRPGLPFWTAWGVGLGILLFVTRDHVTPQGKYLFLAMVPLALLFGWGIRNALPPAAHRRAVPVLAAGLLLLDLWCLWRLAVVFHLDPPPLLFGHIL